MKNIIPSMQHLNNNLLCAVDVETTGLDPSYHEIVEVAIVPLNGDLEPCKEIPAFHRVINPAHKDRAAKKSLGISGITQAALEAAPGPLETADAFANWFKKYVEGWSFRKIAPLAHNWKFDQAFIQQWLGWDMDDPTRNKAWMDSFFEPRARDTMRVGVFVNDLAYLRNQAFPFPKVNLAYMANIFEIPHERAHNAYHDALVTAELYKKLLQMKATNLMIDFGE